MKNSTLNGRVTRLETVSCIVMIALIDEYKEPEGRSNEIGGRPGATISYEELYGKSLSKCRNLSEKEPHPVRV